MCQQLERSKQSCRETSRFEEQIRSLLHITLQIFKAFEWKMMTHCLYSLDRFIVSFKALQELDNVASGTKLFWNATLTTIAIVKNCTKWEQSTLYNYKFPIKRLVFVEKIFYFYFPPYWSSLVFTLFPLYSVQIVMQNRNFTYCGIDNFQEGDELLWLYYIHIFMLCFWYSQIPYIENLSKKRSKNFYQLAVQMGSYIRLIFSVPNVQLF